MGIPQEFHVGKGETTIQKGNLSSEERFVDKFSENLTG